MARFRRLVVVVAAWCAACTNGGAKAFPEVGSREFRQFDVDGTTAWAATTLAQLPERASRVEFAAVIIDKCNGPVLCVAGVMKSLPPQCNGPRIKASRSMACGVSRSAG